jgi:hypothetical protein
MFQRPKTSDRLGNEGDDSSSVAMLDQDEVTLSPVVKGPDWTGPRCEKCAAPIKSTVVSICRSCGWYPSLGTFVELDANWETSDSDSTEVAEAAPAKSHIRFWLDLMPRWSWVMIASALAIVAESVAARFATGGSLRTTWSLVQLALGAFAVAGSHIFTFMVLVTEDADFGVFDIVLRPIKVWARAVRELPKRLWVANSAVCGLMAIAMSFLVIGALPYERLWDWGFQAPVKQDLMGAVMDRAKQLDSADGDLEDAIGDFAGKAGVDGEGLPIAEPEKPRDKTDCVILGYQLDRDGRLETLILGAANGSKLVLAGRVRPEMEEEARSQLLMSLAAIKRNEPFITIEADATWVEPKIACRVTYGEKLKGGALRDVQWDSLLGTMRTSK